MQRKTGLRPEISAAKNPETTAGTSMPAVAADEHALFTPEMRQQLDTVFSRMERTLLLKLYLDSRPVSAELENFITALAALSDKLDLEVCDRQAQETFAPCVEICFADGTQTGLAFHGVPSGHEFTSFVLGLYNAAGPGQALDGDLRESIAAITNPTDIKILVTLSCTMCPDLVVAAQRIAAGNPNVTAHVYDIRHFEGLKNRYNVMSVPCLIINDDNVSFGKKNIQQILDQIFPV
jgi:thioredoxin reductase (NADPH)